MTYAVNIAQGGSNNTTFRNRIINGAMVIDQRNAGASVSVSTAEIYTLDRWAARLMSGSGHTVQRSTTAPVGFANSLLVTVGTGASPAAGDRNVIPQKIEGFNVADLAFGTASASSITISFAVRSSVTGTFGGAIANSATNRSYPFTYTINAANTFETKTVTIPGDTTGTWLTDSGIGMYLWLDIGSGTTYQGAAGSWAAADYRAASGTTKLIITSGATFYITGVQLEAGTTATPFEQRLYGTELALCQRYYVKTFPQATAPAQNAGNTGALEVFGQVANTAIVVNWMLPVEMRDTPSTVTTYSTNAASANWSTNTQTPTASIGSTGSKLISVRAGTSLAAGSVYQINATASAEL